MSIFFLKWWRGSDWSEFCQALFQRFRKDLGFLDFFATPISNLRELVDNRICAWVCFYKFLYAMGALCYFALKEQSFIKWNHKFHQPMCWATENLTPSNFPLLDEEMVSVWANEAMCNFPVRFLRHWFSPRTTSLRPPMLKAMWSATHRCSDRWGCFRFGTGRSDVVWHWYEVLSYDVSWYDMVWYDSGVCVCFPSAQLSCHGAGDVFFEASRTTRSSFGMASGSSSVRIELLSLDADWAEILDFSTGFKDF